MSHSRVHVTRWPQAIPVYDHSILALKQELTALPAWLALAGNYLGTIGVAALLARAESAATGLALELLLLQRVSG